MTGIDGLADALRAKDSDSGKIILLAIDDVSKTLRINNWVWDIGTTAWVKMKQPTLELTGDLTVTLGDVERLLANQYYKRMTTYSHASGRIKYICRNTAIDAATTDTDWFCWKYTDASPPEVEGPLQGPVNTEAAVNLISWNT